jgi:L-amino acid N-acyltransferase YncA
MALLRLAEERDAAAVAAIYASIVEHTAISFETTPPTPAEMAGRISKTLEHYPWLVCAEEEQVLGYVYASRHKERAAYRWTVDVTAYVAEIARSRGVGRALYTSLLALLRLQGFVAAYAVIVLPNPASVRLHEAVGFQPVGICPAVGYKAGAWQDVGWWQCSLHKRASPPAEPLSLAAARALPGWAAALADGEALLNNPKNACHP